MYNNPQFEIENADVSQFTLDDDDNQIDHQNVSKQQIREQNPVLKIEERRSQASINHQIEERKMVSQYSTNSMSRSLSYQQMGKN